jgi:hypothetical protein
MGSKLDKTTKKRIKALKKYVKATTLSPSEYSSMQQTINKLASGQEK